MFGAWNLGFILYNTTVMGRFLNWQDKTFKVGDTITVGYKIREVVKGKEKERVQDFTGILIKVRGEGNNKTFTVRKISKAGIGVERIIPIVSPWIAYIKPVRKTTYTKARALFIRDRSGSEIRKRLYKSKK